MAKKRIFPEPPKPEDFGETLPPKKEIDTSVYNKDDTHKYDDVYTHTSTDKHTHTYEHIKQPQQQERKKKRVQLLTLESLVDRMDAYAAKRGVPRVAVFEAAVAAYLDMVDPQD